MGEHWRDPGLDEHIHEYCEQLIRIQHLRILPIYLFIEAVDGLEYVVAETHYYFQLLEGGGDVFQKRNAFYCLEVGLLIEISVQKVIFIVFL